MFGFEILILIGPFVIPFFIGLNVASKKWGLIPLMTLPALSIALGSWLILSGNALTGPQATPTDFAAVWCIGVGTYLATVFAICWMLGRFFRKRAQSSENQTTFNPNSSIAIDGGNR